MSAAPRLTPAEVRHLRRARGSLALTSHAIHQYADRHGGTEAECRTLAERAVPTRERTPAGQEVWTADGVRFVVKRDRGLGPVAVTVLPRLSEMSGYDAADDMPDGGWW